MGDKQRALREAAREGNLERVRHLVQGRRANPNWPDKNYGNTPLHEACWNDRTDVVQFLIKQASADVNVRDQFGRTPLHKACGDGNLDVVQFLIQEAGADVNVRDKDGRTPLHGACRYGNTNVVRWWLTNVGSDALSVPNNDGKTPLQSAKDKGRLEVVYLLQKWSREAESSVERKKEEKKEREERRRKEAQDREKERMRLAELARVKKEEQKRRKKDVEEREKEPIQLAEYARKKEEERREKARQETEQGNIGSQLHKVAIGSLEGPLVVPVDYIKSIMTTHYLGSGYFGSVHKGHDKSTGMSYAVKTVNRKLLIDSTPDQVRAVDKTFIREQQVLSKFRHPNIAQLYGYHLSWKDHPCLIYELAEKGSLDKFWKNDLGRQRLGSFQRRVEIAYQVLTAILFLHNGNEKFEACFHRDIKSANIVLDKNFMAKLIDCGLAKFVRESKDGGASTTSIKGTEGYMCPAYERGRLERYEAACDIFSFGVVLAELWCGRLQNHKKSALDRCKYDYYDQYTLEKDDMHRDLDPTIASSEVDDKAMKLYVALTLKCLKKNPEDREKGETVLHTLAEILQMLGALGDDTTANAQEERCSRCRTNPVWNHAKELCRVCTGMDELQNALKLLQQRLDHGFNQNQSMLYGLHSTMSGAMTVLSKLDIKWSNAIPRLFVILPAERKKGFFTNARSHLRRLVEAKYHLFFVCADSLQAISPPIKLFVGKQWLRKVAPLYCVSLKMLTMTSKAVTGIPFDLGYTALDCEYLTDLLEDVRSNVEDTHERGADLRNFIDHNDQLSGAQIKFLNGESYELIMEKATEQREWHKELVPVLAQNGSQWVRKDVAQQKGYTIIPI
eukprot:scaffold16003_cov149-Amphora_coffeaeformis.AAC.1